MERPPCRDKTVLQHVIGIVAICDIAADELIQPALVTAHNRRKGGVIARARRDRQCRIPKIVGSRHGLGVAVAVKHRTLRS